jgi:hypothetical protein
LTVTLQFDRLGLVEDPDTKELKPLPKLVITSMLSSHLQIL